MVSEQVRLDPDEASQLDRGSIGDRQLIDDRQTHWIAKRCVAVRPFL